MADPGFLFLILVALSTLAFAIVWTQRNAPIQHNYCLFLRSFLYVLSFNHYLLNYCSRLKVLDRIAIRLALYLFSATHKGIFL